MTRFAWGEATDPGRVRPANEDSMLAVDGLFVVADGMGGHRAGEVASRRAVEVLHERFDAAGTDVLVRAVEDANRAVVAEAAADDDKQGMGTTLCAMALVDVDGHDALAVVNVGDSRLYLLSGGELTQITDDHSLVATMERQGRLTRAEAAVHPKRNILTRALGTDAAVVVDSWEIVPLVGDRYLLCSDGLFNEVDENRLGATLRRLADPGEAARELVRLANEAGGRDNITVVVVDVVDAATPSGASRPATTNASATPAAAPAAAPVPGPSASSSGGSVASMTATTGATAGRRTSSRRFTWRVGAFLAAFAAIVIVGVGAIVWTGSRTFYVGVEGDRVAIFKGRPGGVLWIQPQLAETTELALAQVPSASRAAVESGREQASLDAARTYVDNLIAEATAVVPDVVGQTQATAVGAVAGAGLRVVVVTLPSTTAAVGTVTAVAPAAGSRLDRGASVTLTLSGGPPPVDTLPAPGGLATVTPDPAPPGAPVVAPVVVP